MIQKTMVSVCVCMLTILYTMRMLYTVYCKLFKVEKFRGFRGLIGDRETFPAKHFRSSFKLECHGGTL